MRNTATRFCQGDGVSLKESAARGVSDPDALSVVVLMGPTVVTMSTSWVVKDEVMRVTYMDTMTTLVGRVTLSGPKQEASTQGPTIQDVTDLI